MPLAYRTGPPHPERHGEQGKPVVLPVMAGEPQGTLLALRVKECGESERPAVMDGIRAETLPDAKAGSAWSFMARVFLTNRNTGESR